MTSYNEPQKPETFGVHFIIYSLHFVSRFSARNLCEPNTIQILLNFSAVRPIKLPGLNLWLGEANYHTLLSIRLSLISLHHGRFAMLEQIINEHSDIPYGHSIDTIEVGTHNADIFSTA